MFFDPPKKTPPDGKPDVRPPKWVFSTPHPEGVFSTRFTDIRGHLMDDATNLHRVAQVVNTTRRSNPGSSSGPAIPTELTTWSGEADVNIDPATYCLGRCLMSTRCRPVMNMSSVRRHQISR